MYYLINTIFVSCKILQRHRFTQQDYRTDLGDYSIGKSCSPIPLLYYFPRYGIAP